MHQSSIPNTACRFSFKQIHRFWWPQNSKEGKKDLLAPQIFRKMKGGGVESRPWVNARKETWHLNITLRIETWSGPEFQTFVLPTQGQKSCAPINLQIFIEAQFSSSCSSPPLPPPPLFVGIGGGGRWNYFSCKTRFQITTARNLASIGVKVPFVPLILGPRMFDWGASRAYENLRWAAAPPTGNRAR